jgi:hypothetical protein
MTRRLIHHIRRNIIGYTAIFLALGGTSYAAWLAPADSVNSAAIIDGQVTTPDLAQNVIRADENCALYYGCWGSKEIANGAVASSEIAGGAVGNTQLADASVNSQKIVLGSILGNRIAPQAIGNSQLAPDAVTGDKVKDGSITAADIAGGIPPAAEAYIARNDNIQTISGTGTTVVSLNLPAGYYTLTGTSELWNYDTDKQHSDCTLSTGSTDEVTVPGTGPYSADAGIMEVTVQDLLTLTSPGTVYLHCHTYNGWARHAKLIAIKVAALHG